MIIGLTFFAGLSAVVISLHFAFGETLATGAASALGFTLISLYFAAWVRGVSIHGRSVVELSLWACLVVGEIASGSIQAGYADFTHISLSTLWWVVVNLAIVLALASALHQHCSRDAEALGVGRRADPSSVGSLVSLPDSIGGHPLAEGAHPVDEPEPTLRANQPRPRVYRRVVFEPSLGRAFSRKKWLSWLTPDLTSVTPRHMLTACVVYVSVYPMAGLQAYFLSTPVARQFVLDMATLGSILLLIALFSFRRIHDLLGPVVIGVSSCLLAVAIAPWSMLGMWAATVVAFGMAYAIADLALEVWATDCHPYGAMSRAVTAGEAADAIRTAGAPDTLERRRSRSSRSTRRVTL